MEYLESVIYLFKKHQPELIRLASEQASIYAVRLNLQLNRARTSKEQLAILTNFYQEASKILRRFEDNQAHLVSFLAEVITATDTPPSELWKIADKFRNINGVGDTPHLDPIIFEEIFNLPLNEIPESHPIMPIFKECMNYFAHQDFFDRISQLMDMLESDEKKLSAEEIKEVKEEKVISLTVAQKVLTLYKMMKWAGIEPQKGKSSEQQRFIAALTGLRTASIKEKFPTGKNIEKEGHLTNLEALLPLFEAMGALEAVQKIKADIQFERQERQEGK